MSKTIEVYIKTQKQSTLNPVFVQADPGHGCTHVHGDGLLPSFENKTEKILPENEKQALETAKIIAKDNGFKLKIYDLSTKIGQFKAYFRKIETTPTIIVNDRIIKGEITENGLLSIVKLHRE